MNNEDTQLLTTFETMLTEHRNAINDDVAKKLLPVQNDHRTLLMRSARPPGSFTPSSDSAGLRAPIEALTSHAGFSTWLQQPQSSRSSFVFEVPFRLEKKATILNIGGTTYAQGVSGPQQPALRLAELIPHVEVNVGAAVQWTKETGFVPSADIVAEGAVKPASSLTFANVVTNFVTVATVTKASLQSLSDVPVLMSWIDNRLSYAVLLRQEQYLLNDATAGLLVNASALDPAYAPGAGATSLDLIGAAISQLQAAGYSVDGVVLSGVDANKMRLLKNSYGEYLWSSPDSAIGTTAVWSVPVVISPSMAAGTFLVGAFGQSTILFDRATLRVDISYENEDDFIKNLCTIRAELRSALAIPVPAGLLKGTVTLTAANANHEPAHAPHTNKK
jgi:hypothetical protein